jgi:large subunit ribosomal protein L29
MANARATELLELGDGELHEQLANAKDKLFKLRFQRVTGQMENHAEITSTKRDVARILTELRAREIAAAEALATVPADKVSKR